MKLVLLDSLSIINRAFYALPPTLTDSEGRVINAVYGYMNILSRIIRELKPTHIVATFDVHAPTFRHIEYTKYKATRKAMPEELVGQIPILKDLLCKMNIACIEQAGFEADDIIGSLSKKFDIETIIVTGDKDSLQLIDDTTKVWLTKGNLKEIIFFDKDKLFEVYGLSPMQIIDLKALMGDASDNIPGVHGIGEVTALKLIKDYANVENLYANIEKISGKLKDKLVEGKELCFISKHLATINTNVKCNIELDGMILSNIFSAEVCNLFSKLRFKSLMDKFNFESEKTNESGATSKTEILIDSEASLQKILKDNENKKEISIYFNFKEFNFAYDNQINYRIVIEDGFLAVFSLENLIEKFKKNIYGYEKVVCFSIKEIKHTINESQDGKNINAFDLSIASYLIDSSRVNESIQDLVVSWGYINCNTAAVMFELYEKFKNTLNELNLNSLYYDVELPLADVLFDLEKVGFSVDKNVLTELEASYTLRLNELTKNIYESVGCEFNINSPKQLSEILFNKLKLPMGKKNKTGASTNADVLNELKPYHPSIKDIITYRQLSKLNSTYCIGLSKLVDKEGKIHTEFKQTLTQTGRLSSQEPNLQNIPIRDEEGRELRKAFTASKGNMLVCSDYSQIELRLLAHMAQDKTLMEAYKNNVDIHTYTASLVFRVKLNEVTVDMRRYAKAVNFGIIYGMSDYGLATTISIPVYVAKDFIVKYFNTYTEVKNYMANNVAYAKENGFIKTLLGRIRYIKEINSSNFNIRSFGERVAMNMPLQGSAADIIKLAMLNVFNRLKKEGLKAKLILQVHDELIVDTPLDELDKVKVILQYEMENAYKLSIPMLASVGVGINWFEAK